MSDITQNIECKSKRHYQSGGKCRASNLQLNDFSILMSLLTFQHEISVSSIANATCVVSDE
jgi:hypothetical protein